MDSLLESLRNGPTLSSSIPGTPLKSQASSLSPYKRSTSQATAALSHIDIGSQALRLLEQMERKSVTSQ